ncbi:MAG: lysozyme inhibitor LprI family protein [Hydrogenophaga sp.]|uniref:lysozyme inhibitor LprI family protein n=1 Tax=Hydrogenophaga sp. TaxID=1904254 RepID=UPI0026305822|nr:lysozyme inhibitor LprI family protein [Hydrogenophaga sp.]MCV0440790.1 lysozyme inhibitor LprI family protein [Hydrogenophaga sp.]
MKSRLVALFLSLSCAAAWAQPAGFDCAQASAVAEHLVCAHPDLAEADRALNALYRAVLKKPTRPPGLRQEQLRWLRTTRNRCANADCLRSAYRQRVAVLHALNIRPLSLTDAAFQPVLERAIARIDDTWVVGGLRLRANAPRRLQLELHVDPGDHLDWTLWGPRVQLFCTHPGRREGYAGRFEHRDQANGIDFLRVRRAQAQGFVLMRFELGKALPLNEDIVCSVGFTEWLLDRPSTLYVVDVPPP